MFKKRKCNNCNEKLGKGYNFCPYCRYPAKNSDRANNENDWGLLGKNDFDTPQGVKLPTGLNTLFSFLMKNITQQLNELDELERSNGKMKKKGIGVNINTSGNRPPEITIRSFGALPQDIEQKKKQKKPAKKSNKGFSKEQNKKFASLPKEEPRTNIRRLSNKVIYEINADGVLSLEDVCITPLENSIEVKALAKDKVFSKLIPFNLPIKKYGLSKGKIVLEMEA